MQQEMGSYVQFWPGCAEFDIKNGTHHGILS